MIYTVFFTSYQICCSLVAHAGAGCWNPRSSEMWTRAHREGVISNSCKNDMFFPRGKSPLTDAWIQQKLGLRMSLFVFELHLLTVSPFKPENVLLSSQLALLSSRTGRWCPSILRPSRSCPHQDQVGLGSPPKTASGVDDITRTTVQM